MDENTISYKLDRIKNATDRMRTRTGVVSGVIEDVATAVEGMSVINNQNKDITANGTYNADEGYTGLGTINVNVSSSSGTDINEYFKDTIGIWFDDGEEMGNRLGGWIKTILKLKSPLTIEGTETTGMFYKYPGTEIPQLDTSNVTTMTQMFSYCTNLTTIPQLDTSNATGMILMFNKCTNLTTIPQLDTSKVTNMNSMFCGCTALTEIPQLNTSNVIEMSWLFQDCTNLTTVPQLNMSKVTRVQGMFYNCSNLTDESLNNIMLSLTQSQATTKTTEYINLNADQKERIKSLPAYSSFIAAGWTNS